MPGVHPLALELIRVRYVENRATTRVVVAPLPGSGLPAALVEAGQPVMLDLLAGRPVNLELDETGLSADLCFTGPPVRCRFPWTAVLAVQTPEGTLAQTLVVTMSMVMEDGSLIDLPGEPNKSATTPARTEDTKPRLRLVRESDESADP